MIAQLPLLIFIFPFSATLIVPFFKNNRLMAQTVSVISLALSLAASIAGFVHVSQGNAIDYFMGGWAPPFGIQWRLDSLNALFCILVTGISCIVTLATGATVDREIKHSRIPYYMVVLLQISGLLGMLLTYDLFNMFVFLEVASLTAYALIASGDQVRGNVASFRYVLIGTVGASFYLLGVGYLYAATGTLNMGDMAVILAEVGMNRTVFLGLFLIVIGLAIKMGLFPFHGWLPDAYTHASNSASALIAPLMTKVSIYAFIRIFLVVFTALPVAARYIANSICVLGAIAIVAGSIMAFIQPRLKRMLAYSSISHIGLIMLGFGLNQPEAMMGSILHILNHAIMKAGLFLIAAAAFHRHGIKDVLALSAIRGRMPFSLAALAICALSMIGIPPLAGFFSKWYILVGALRAGQPFYVGVILLSSLLTGLYFFRVLEQAFFQGDHGNQKVEEGPAMTVLASCALASSLFVLGYFGPTVVNWGIRVMPFSGS